MSSISQVMNIFNAKVLAEFVVCAHQSKSDVVSSSGSGVFQNPSADCQRGSREVIESKGDNWSPITQ